MSRRILALVAALALAAALVAGGCDEPAPEEQPLPAPTRAWVEGALVGAPEPCADDEACASGVCRFDSCVGALAADSYWVQEIIARRIAARVETHPALAPVVVQTAREAVAREAGGPVVRARALFVLSFVPGAEVTEWLAASLEDPSARVRRQAALGLATRGDERGLPLVIAELHVRDTRRRAEAARALGGLRDERVVDALTGVLEDDDRFVRRNAIQSLGKMEDPRALRPLVRALENGPANERYLVLRSLRALTDRDLGLDPAEWNAVLDETLSDDAPE